MALAILLAFAVHLAPAPPTPAPPTPASPTDASQPTGSSARPNLVVVFCDDLGWGDLPGFAVDGVTPPAHAATLPNLARLAHEGASFTDFYAAQPVCSASRAAILTGCYPNRIGIEGALFPGGKVGIADEERTLAELLRERGYATAIFGKWHLGEQPRFNPLRHGFDEWIGIPYSNDMWPLRQKSSPRLPLMDGERVLRHLDSVEDQNGLTRLLTERAAAFIRRSAAEGRPFFCYLAHPQPHTPLAASEAFRPAERTALYGGVLREIDWSLGEVLRALDETNSARDTIVLFTSDNGPWLSFGSDAGSTGGLREGKGTVFEGGVRVPCILRWPATVPAGARSAVPWMTIDLLPTIAAITGAPPAADGTPIDGNDARAVWSCAVSAPPTHEAFFFYYDRNALQAVRMGRWKLVLPHRSRTLDGRSGGSEGRETPYVMRDVPMALYDLEKDPQESVDVAASHPEVVEEAMRHVARARADLGDSLAADEGSGRRAPGRASDPDAPSAPSP
jgi:arylsulfatase A